MLMKLPSSKTKVEVILFGSVPLHWDKAKCKAQVEKLQNELGDLCIKQERYIEANGYRSDSTDDQAMQIVQWIEDIEEAMETR